MDQVKKIKVGLDVDGVLANFSDGLIAKARQMGLSEEFPETWEHVDNWDVCEKFLHVMDEARMDASFWLGLKPMTANVPFEVDCYITARSIGSEVTAKWLSDNGFQDAPVISVANPEEKLQHIKDRGLDLFVDDYYKTVINLLEEGINAVLFSAPYQRGHEEECKSLPKIYSLEEVLTYVG